ncbi:hypothetical protein ALC53_05321 [Atta colombica]|uniref:Uncharacterized protein n=1 Tax=Atta colombica TaxID=520822 RepID=A0A195BJI9_9HYME|nr:hypothetical protein ALC53_05321 [Atta colombica]
MREINRTRSKAIREIRCPLLHYHSTDKRFAHSKDPRVVQSCMHDIRSAAHLTRPSDLNKPWFAYDRSGFHFSSSPIMLLQEVHLLCRGGVPFLLASDTHVTLSDNIMTELFFLFFFLSFPLNIFPCLSPLSLPAHSPPAAVVNYPRIFSTRCGKISHLSRAMYVEAI